MSFPGGSFSPEILAEINDLHLIGNICMVQQLTGFSMAQTEHPQVRIQTLIPGKLQVSITEQVTMDLVHRLSGMTSAMYKG